MKLKSLFRYLFYQTTGLSIYKKLPFGICPFDDLRYGFKNYRFETFFDVGANIGQSVDSIHSYFPDAEIWCFEPVLRTFEILKENTVGKNIKYHQIALGHVNKEIEIFIDPENPTSRGNSLINYDQTNQSLVSEKVKIQTLDDFCSINSIQNIDYLKIDTEGYDKEVLQGGTNFLQNRSVAFIEVEVGMIPENKYHVDLFEIKQFLENFEYRLYGIYEQVHEWPTNRPILRRVNTLFISKNIYDKQKYANIITGVR